MLFPITHNTCNACKEATSAAVKEKENQFKENLRLGHNLQVIGCEKKKYILYSKLLSTYFLQVQNENLEEIMEAVTILNPVAKKN